MNFLILMLLFAGFACVVPGMPADVDTVSTSAAETVIAGLTQEAAQVPPPSVEPTLTLTFTPTLIRPTLRAATETLTPIPLITVSLTLPPGSEAPTDTPETVLISVSRPTNCRVGPGKAYDIAGTLLVGEEAEVLGRDATGEYWYIPNPDPGVEFCWVWGEYATLTGMTAFVPVFTPPPTFTPTATSVPGLNFKLRGAGMNSCSGIWWARVEISNLSEYSFKSLKIEMQDLDTGTYRITSSNGFANRKGCGAYEVADAILPNGVFIVDGPKFDYNLRGHTLRGFVTVCTEAELKGICATNQGSFSP
ncbi:MAG: hypothetical protein DPW18_15075 [Chloroflexi bacterium]|nr:hypothetical protein [Chloroflexota bacterium]